MKIKVLLLTITVLLVPFIQMTMGEDQPGKIAATLTGQPFVYPKTDKPEISWEVAGIAPGKESGRHKHSVPTFVYVLQGTVTIVMDDGSKKEYHAGQAYVQPFEIWHNMQNKGKKEVKILGVYIGAEGVANITKAGKE